MQVVTSGIRVCTNRKCEAGPVRRHVWMDPTREELKVLLVLGRVPHETSLRSLTWLSGYLSHITWWVGVMDREEQRGSCDVKLGRL